jgi:hypothetical protein
MCAIYLFLLPMDEQQLVYGQWEGGHHAGFVLEMNGRCYLRMDKINIRETFGSFDATTKDFVFNMAHQRRAVLSLQHEVTRNQYRRVSTSNGTENWLEVQLTQGQVMQCDLQHLPLIQEKIWNASKSNRTFYARTTIDDKAVPFHRLVTEFDIVDHIDKNGLNNRLSNLRESTPVLNGRNRRTSNNNTSGRIGVTVKKNGKVEATWNDATGKPRSASFSIKKLGYDEAFRRAVNIREYQEKLLGITPDITLPAATMPKPYHCPYCKFKSTYKAGLPIHIKRNHVSSE